MTEKNLIELGLAESKTYLYVILNNVLTEKVERFDF